MRPSTSAVHHPTAILRRLRSTDPERYARDLLAPNMNDADKDFECIVASGAFRTIFNRPSGIHLLERLTWPERSRPADLKCQHS